MIFLFDDWTGAQSTFPESLFGQKPSHHITWLHWNARFEEVSWGFLICVSSLVLRCWKMFARVLGVFEKLERPTHPTTLTCTSSKGLSCKNIFNMFTMHFVSASFFPLALVKRIWFEHSAKHFEKIQSQSLCHQIDAQHHPNLWVSCSHMWILTSKGRSCSNYKQIPLNFTEIDNNGNKNSLFHDEHYQ